MPEVASKVAGVVERDEGDERDEQGGDPACWLDRVCAECGRLVESGDVCPACGARLER
jgi:rubrerythrin